jgi:hypothetical protein
MPGSRIPIVPASLLQGQRPDCLVILPWNIATEIVKQNEALKTKGVRFVTTVPELEVL